MNKQLLSLEQRLPFCMIRDRHRLRQSLKRLQARAGDVHKLRRLEDEINRSQALAGLREEQRPAVSYPAGLPVSERVAEISRAISGNQVVVIAGETGSGKTTQIPKICLQLGRGIHGRIAHTQPRRLAARSVAARIAEELDVTLGEEVGYQVRFSDNSSDRTHIKLMTDGVLLAEIQHDPWLNQYDTIIIDEAHERSLNIDFLLGYLKRLLPRRPDLKLIITSATIDVEKFSRHFDNAPVIEVSGRTYPVEIAYREPEAAEELEEQVLHAVEDILHYERRHPSQYPDILVFLSGEKEIRDVALYLRKAQLRHTEILPLYARLSNKEQQRVFQSHPGRRIVLSTNVAETSLTVPGIGYVIDSGTARISRYSVRSKIQRLPVEAVSQASANQRAGRCGRLGPGFCIRLYSEEDFNGRPAFTDTEITRTHLGSVILQMLSLGLGDIERFPFVDMPDSRAIRDGFRLLEELGAVDERHRLTKRGRQMARLPLDPSFARMILEADRLGCLKEILIITSALSIQDPRERPLEKQQAADQRHALHRHPESDFMGFVQLWESFEEERQALSQNQLRKYCQKYFLSWMRMREWREVHRQLALVCRDMKLRQNTQSADYEVIHKSLLSGLLSQIAMRLEQGDYLGARNRKFQLFPGSTLFRKKCKWILAAELVETSRLYARMNARIEPEWVERQAPPELLKREYFEPYWSQRRGRVMTHERVSLYGLVLVEKRRVPLSPVDPVLAREFFIREALVELNLNCRASFVQHNRAMLERVRALEDKTRRRDLVVDEGQIEHFYQERLPAQVFDVRSLEQWYRGAARQEPGLLKLSEKDLTRQEADEVDLSQFPDQIQTSSMALKLDYQFAPGAARDGVSVNVPLVALKQVRDSDLDWLVPGMLREKCIALVKALPKSLRKHFVPVPDHVDRLMTRLQAGEGELKLQLARELERQGGVKVDPGHWQGYRLDEHLQMNINIVDERGEVLGAGRDLAELRETFADQVQDSLARIADSGDSIECEGLREWSFNELPQRHEINRGGMQLHTFPALIDEGDSVAIKLLDSADKARRETVAALVRLLQWQTSQQLKHMQKHLFQSPVHLPLLKHLGQRSDVVEQVVYIVYVKAFDLENSIPRQREVFQRLSQEGKGQLIESAESLEKLISDFMKRYHEIRSLLKKTVGVERLELYQDIGRQLDALVYPGFLRLTPLQCLMQYPRYLKAIELRLERFPLQQQKDRQWRLELALLWQQYQERQDWCRKQEVRDQALDHYRWMVEEYRVSLFAQQLGTQYPVSAKRLQKQWLQVGKG